MKKYIFVIFKICLVNFNYHEKKWYSFKKNDFSMCFDMFLFCTINYNNNSKFLLRNF